MGMFDEVVCEITLPDKEAQNLIFQTKDLECMLDRYTITEDGRLTSSRFGDVDFHGDIHIYATMVRTPDGGLHNWSMVKDGKYYCSPYKTEMIEGEPVRFEYKVRFTEGRLLRLWKFEE